EFNSRGLQLKSYFQDIRNYSSHDVALYALGMGAVDVAVAEFRVAEKWLAANKGRVILETKAVPSIGIALNASLDKAVRQKIRDALLSPNPKRKPVAQLAGGGNLEIKAAAAGGHPQVLTPGYFAATVPPGIKSVAAEEGQHLVAKGVP